MNVLQKQLFTMPKRKRTQKSKYKHQTTGDYCTCAAYVAEIMCIRNAEHKNEGSLPYKFWNKKPWNWTFKRQLMVARKLIKKYSETALIQAIHCHKLKSTFSLNNKRVLPVLKQCQKSIDKEQSKKQELNVKQNPVNRKKTYGKKSALNKLRSIDINAKKNKS